MAALGLQRNPNSRQRKPNNENLKPEVKGAPEIKRDEIEESEKVGSGQYGDVYRGRCRGYEVAIKILKNKFGSDEHLASFKREVEIMSRIRFPNVCLLLGACTDPEYFCIVQEYLPGGDLAMLLEKGKLPTSFYARMRLASQVARGLLWIHSNGVLHRDLKLENLLLDTHGEVKVCDFGLADNTGGMKYIWDEKGRKGSPLYMAPEVLQKKALNGKVDVYSFGLILWELLSGKRAFQEHLKHNDLGLFTNAICEKMERPLIPPEKSNEEGWNNIYVVNLIKRCWSDKAKERPEFQEIYDELNVLITEGYIKDEWGRTFWLINFPDQDTVPWDEFIKILMCKKTVALDDGTIFNKGLSMTRKDPENEKKARCLHLLLAQISGQKNFAFQRVSCENFGKALSWFGPGVDNDPKAQHKNFLDRLAYIARQPWFFGLIDNADLLLHDLPRKPVYMIRLSFEPGYFTIHTKKMKTRMVYTPNRGYKPEGQTDVFLDLVEFAETHLKAYEPQSGSEYTKIFGENNQDLLSAGAYQLMSTLMINEGAEEGIEELHRVISLKEKK